MEERFEFTCDGDRLIGVLYWPQDAPRAALVTTGPLTSLEQIDFYDDPLLIPKAADVIAAFLGRGAEAGDGHEG